MTFVVDRRRRVEPLRQPLHLPDLLEGFSEPAAILAEGRHIVAANRSFSTRFAGGTDPLGRLCHELLHGCSVPCEERGVDCPLTRCLAGCGPVKAFHGHQAKLGTEPVELTVCEVTQGQGGVAYFLHLTRSLPNGWLPA